MSRIFAIAVLATVLAASSLQAAPITFSATATTAAGITPIRDDFRAAIGGGTVAGANGSFGGVRREINWDGVPDMFSAPNNMPPDFFNVNSPRGAVFSTPGTGFQVSANAGIAATEFGNINATYPATFATFSAQRLFTALGSTVTDVNFFLAGTTTRAATSAFGAIFTDVDLPNTSSLEFFDFFTNASLGTFFVPALAGSETFEFLGVKFETPTIGRVRITSGNTALGPNDGGATDVAVMDDFIYAEPQAVPEPGSLILLGSGVAVLAASLRRRVRR